MNVNVNTKIKQNDKKMYKDRKINFIKLERVNKIAAMYPNTNFSLDYVVPMYIKFGGT